MLLDRPTTADEAIAGLLADYHAKWQDGAGSE